MVRTRAGRLLATVLFVDVVGSTGIAAELGDRRWRELLRSFRRLVRHELKAHRGREQDTAGDGFFGTFDRPAAALLAAAAIVRETQKLGLDVRCGVHAGELERIDGRLGGIAAHIGARVMALAGPAEVLATATARDLAIGADLEFAAGDQVELRGVPGRFQLNRLIAVDGAPLPPPLERDGLAFAMREPQATGRSLLSPAAVALVLAVAVSVPAVILFRVDLGSSPTPTVSPESAPRATTLLRLDARTNEITHQVRDVHVSAGRAAELNVVDGTLWHVTPTSIVRRDVVSGEAQGAIDRTPGSFGVTFGFGSVWAIGSEAVDGDQLLRIDPLSRRVIATIDPGTAVSEMVVGPNAVWLLGIREVIEVDPGTNVVVDRDALQTQEIPGGMTPVGDLLWLCECEAGRIIEFDPRSDEILRTVSSGQPGFVLPDQRRSNQGVVSINDAVLWLLDGQRGTVTPIDTATGEVGLSIGVPADVLVHAFGLGSLWLVTETHVHRVDLESAQSTRIAVPEGLLIGGIAVDEETETVWLATCLPAFARPEFGPCG